LYLFFLFLSGVLSILSQNILIREIYMIFHGNELTYGLVVSFWLFGAGIGSFLGRRINEEKLYLPFLILSLYFPLSIYLLRFLPAILGYRPGEIFSISLLFIETAFLLFPIYLNFGLIFALGQKKFSQLSKSDLKGITRPYIVDSIGDLLGGIFFSYIFVSFLSPARKPLLLSVLFITPAVILKGKKFIPLALIFLGVLFFPGIKNSIKKTYEKLYTGFTVEQIIETKYGRYMEIKKDGQFSFFSNGILSYTYPDTITSEYIHIPLLLSPHQEKEILYLGLADPGLIKELSKYKNFTIVHADARVQKTLEQHIDSESLKKISYIASDPRLFLKRTEKKFDAIFLGIGDPLSISSNRFYTEEFSKLLREKINNEGIVSFSISSGENYLNKTTLDYNSLIFWTYKFNFTNYLVIPGYTARYIFSNSPIAYEEERIKREIKKLNLQYLDEYIIQSQLPAFRIKEFEEQLNTNFIGFNSDKKPRAFILALLHYMEKNNQAIRFLKPIFNIPVFLIFLLLPVPIIFRRTAFRISLIGAISIVISYCCIISLQIIYGNVYHLLGLITGLFMFGVGTGTYITEKTKLQKNLKIPFLTFAILLFTQFLIINMENPIFWAFLLIPLISFVCGTVVGWTYTNAGIILEKKGTKYSAAPSVYAFDLIGGSAGALLFSFLFLPVFGIIPTILCFIGICLLAYLFA
jgi:spermidine synthase